jgi:dienelactone hydrolase
MTRLALLLLVTVGLHAAEPPFRPSAEALARLRDRNAELLAALQRIPATAAGDLVDDVAIHHKAVDYILRYPEQFYREAYYGDALKLIDAGLRRAAELQRGAPSWPTARGPVCRAYQSSVDGSLQPYALWVPASYDASRPQRLNVVMHGRNPTLNEVSFLTQGSSERVIGIEGGRKSPPEHLTLYVFGRANNSYRWAGETDVFEAIASVRRRYNVDPERIVLRGFSMGGTGAWHLGLHFPSRWAAVEAGAGYIQTRPEVLETIHESYRLVPLAIHDASNCAVNMINVPFVGYAGEEDVQRESHDQIRRVLERDRCDITAFSGVRFLVGPKTGHSFHPESKRESDAFLDASLPRRQADTFRFVAYTPSYGTFWDMHLDSLESCTNAPRCGEVAIRLKRPMSGC